jgi:hypothetical protein
MGFEQRINWTTRQGIDQLVYCIKVERNKERINLRLPAWLRDGHGTNSDEDALDLGGDTARCCDVLESDEAEEASM